jgi:hypothetical protein
MPTPQSPEAFVSKPTDSTRTQQASALYADAYSRDAQTPAKTQSTADQYLPNLHFGNGNGESPVDYVTPMANFKARPIHPFTEDPHKTTGYSQRPWQEDPPLEEEQEG